MREAKKARLRSSRVASLEHLQLGGWKRGLCGVYQAQSRFVRCAPDSVDEEEAAEVDQGTASCDGGQRYRDRNVLQPPRTPLEG